MVHDCSVYLVALNHIYIRIFKPFVSLLVVVCALFSPLISLVIIMIFRFSSSRSFIFFRDFGWPDRNAVVAVFRFTSFVFHLIHLFILFFVLFWFLFSSQSLSRSFFHFVNETAVVSS